MASRPGASQVLTLDPSGANPRWLGRLGLVTGLKYSYAFSGGCDQLSCTLARPPDFRTDAMNPGRTVQVWRGLSKVWDGKLDEPQPSTSGWEITAHGSGTFGSDFAALWSGSFTPNTIVNAAIARGLRWRNTAGISGTGLWLGQPFDSGSQQIDSFMQLVTSEGGYGWSVDRRDGTLTVALLPSVPDRLLVATAPVARTITADVSVLEIRYCATDDGAGNQTFAVTEVTNAASIAAHGRMEQYLDLSGAGVMTAGAAQANGNAILSHYVRANWAGPFTVSQGQYLNSGGYPVDLGCEHAGKVARLIMTDGGYGGEVSPAPITFIVGAYEYDDDAQVATVTPYQSIADDLGSLMSALATAITPISVAA